MIKAIYKKIVSEKIRNQIRENLEQMKAPFYYGDQVDCNCCDKSFSKFLPKGNIVRENAKCPKCGSLERTRLLLHYLRNETDVFEKPLKLLHFAPEKALFNILNSLPIEYIDGDINRANARFVIDATHIPYEDGYFDLVICSHVLGHIPDEAKAIREIKRVLKKGGQAIMMTLIDLEAKETYEDGRNVTDKERLCAYGEFDLQRLHGLDFEDRLCDQGFNVKRIDYRESISEEQLRREHLGNGQRELIFKCTI